MTILLTIVHILICFFLILVVLTQQGKGQDLASAFGGAGSQAAFGARGTATLLTKVTAVVAATFMVTSLLLGYVQGDPESESVVNAPGITTPAPARRDSRSDGGGGTRRPRSGRRTRESGAARIRRSRPLAQSRGTLGGLIPSRAGPRSRPYNSASGSRKSCRSSPLPKWWNGRHVRLRGVWELSRGGSNPPFGTRSGGPGTGCVTSARRTGTPTGIVDAPRFRAARRCAPRIETSSRAFSALRQVPIPGFFL